MIKNISLAKLCTSYDVNTWWCVTGVTVKLLNRLRRQLNKPKDATSATSVFFFLHQSCFLQKNPFKGAGFFLNYNSSAMKHFICCKITFKVAQCTVPTVENLCFQISQQCNFLSNKFDCLLYNFDFCKSHCYDFILHNCCYSFICWV